MSDEKKWTIAGLSTLDGTRTFRFATGKVKTRAAKLKRHGHLDIELFELPNPMTKEEAKQWLLSQGKGSDAVIPTNRKAKPVELTEEEKAKAEAAAKKAAEKAAKAAAKAAKAAAKKAKEDAAFVAGMTGETPPEIQEAGSTEAKAEDETGDGDEEVEEAVARQGDGADTIDGAALAGADELLSRLAEDGEQAQPKEMGVDGERAAAEAKQPQAA